MRSLQIGLVALQGNRAVAQSDQLLVLVRQLIAALEELLVLLVQLLAQIQEFARGTGTLARHDRSRASFGLVQLALQTLNLAVLGAASLECVFQIRALGVGAAHQLFELSDARALTLDLFAVFTGVAQLGRAR